jgi:hypothetical protein
MRRVLSVAATLAIAGVALTLDRSPSDDAGQVTLGAILIGSFALGAWLPHRAWLAGLVLGSMVALSRAVALVMGAPPVSATLPPGWSGVASLLVLVIPAVAAAWAGAGLRRLLRPDGIRPPA